MTIAENIHTIEQQIQDITKSAQRPDGSVMLLAVSKGQSVEKISQAYAAGLRHFGENYWQEAYDKILSFRHQDIKWHFIGPIQSNKCKGIAQSCHWAHSIERIDIVKRLDRARPQDMEPLNVCIQVNIDNEKSKSGVLASEVIAMGKDILPFSNIRLRGLMAIPSANSSAKEQIETFSRLSKLLHALNSELDTSCDTLSMGMSRDWQNAIRAGSTMIRLGTAIFGDRS